jgi:uncharacterized protein YndB with AHSA1/START domain
MSDRDAATQTSDRDLVIERIFDAPRQMVFDAWTDPETIGQWWGPRGFTTTVHEMDVRPGGVWRFTMHGPDGTDYPNRVVYDEVVAPERLVYTHGADDDSGFTPFSRNCHVQPGRRGHAAHSSDEVRFCGAA